MIAFMKSSVLLSLMLTAAVPVAYAVADNASALEFPSVSLSRGSVPLYTTLAANAAGDQPLYVLFDGNDESGYNAVKVWSPGHPGFDRVKTYGLRNGLYKTFKANDPTHRDEPDIEWSLLSEIVHVEARPAGTRSGTKFNYETGKTVKWTKKIPARSERDVVTFKYQVRVTKSTGAGKGLDVLFSGVLRPAENWKGRGSSLTPWREMGMGMVFNPIEVGKKQGLLQCKSSIGYRGRYRHGNVRLASVSEEDAVLLVVRPYMESPVYSNAVHLAQMMTDGVHVDLPYGWYRVNWRLDSNILYAPPAGGGLYPFSREKFGN